MKVSADTTTPSLQDTADIGNLVAKAAEFGASLTALKTRLSSRVEFPWYMYDTLANIHLLSQTLTGWRRNILDITKGKPIVDLGCGDGDLAFFLESLGHRVIAIDHRTTNMNGMQGVRALKEELNSSIEIVELDIDENPKLPGNEMYSLVIFLGVLYHVQNPYRILQSLSKQTEYLITSTRVARYLPGHQFNIRDVPMAFLLEENEINNDNTNYWIFSKAGLQRLIGRAGWRISDYAEVGNTTDSDPITPTGDERAFCFLESKHRISNGLLTEGFFEHEVGTPWRWSAPQFTVAFPYAVEPSPRHLLLEFAISDTQLAAVKEIEISGTINGQAIPPQRYNTAGKHQYRGEVPWANISDKTSLTVTISANPPFLPGGADRRSLGLIVSSVRFE